MATKLSERVKEKQAFKKSFNVSPTGRLFFSAPGTHLILTASNGNTVEVEALVLAETVNEAKAITETIRLRARAVDKQTVRIESRSLYNHELTNWKKHENTHITLVIGVPEKLQVDIHASGGRHSLKGLKGKTSVQLSGGALETQDLGGRLELYGYGCEIELEHFDGENLSIVMGGGSLDSHTLKAKDIALNISSSDVNIERIEGKAELNFHSGQVEIKEAIGPVSANAHGCDFKLHLSRVEETHLDIIGGELDLHLQKKMEAKLLIEGQEVELDGALPFAGDQTDERIEGVLNNGKNLLHAQVASGSIRCKAVA